jgi:calcineurin-like phosphoesterase
MQVVVYRSYNFSEIQWFIYKLIFFYLATSGFEYWKEQDLQELENQDATNISTINVLANTRGSSYLMAAKNDFRLDFSNCVGRVKLGTTLELCIYRPSPKQ